MKPANPFTLTDEQRLIEETARAALAAFADNAALVALEQSDTGYDADAWARMTELGWPGFACTDAPIVEVGLLMEAVGWAAYPSPLLQVTCAATLLRALAPDAPHADRIARGEIIVPLPTTTTVNEWAAHATELLVLDRRPDGWALRSLPTKALDIRQQRSLDNERVGVVELDGVGVGTPPLATGLSDDAVADALARVRLLRAAEMAGGARRTLSLTRDYMLERRQFGVALGSFQAVQHHLANMLIDVDAALLSTREGLSLAALGREIELAAAIAGYVAGRSYTRVTITAAQLFAGIGAVKEHRLHHHFRRAKAMQLRLGPVPSQLLRIADAALSEAQPPGPWPLA